MTKEDTEANRRADGRFKKGTGYFGSPEIPALKDPEQMEKLYVEVGMSMTEISEELGCAVSAVHKWIHRHGIPARSRGSGRLAEGAFGRGEDHRMWEGGERQYYGQGWERNRKHVLEQSGGKCRVCGMSQEESQQQYGHDLDVHHIRPLRSFDTPEEANTVDNLVVLCRGCHARWEGVPVLPEAEK